MGVIGLWSILDAGARPVRLEALAKKRLAVDASIWIYQFLKAVRDKEGNVLKNAHVVGFFRRICKLLFHGIQPVFVFDGKAPLLKKQTLRNRKVLREGGRIDVAKTAGKILAVQMRKRALEESERQKQIEQENGAEEAVPENPVYFDELELKPVDVQKQRFKKTDQYHLPELDIDIDRAGSVSDPRIMTHEELQAYAKDYEGGEDMSLYDFSKIDYDGEMFKSLPAADQYSILNAARLRSRLRMGLSTEQLTDMFPDRMAFSKFQIERVKERSDLTNRLMNMNGMNDVGIQRIASERGREYILVKNDTVDGGWSLGVVNSAEKPIIIDKELQQIQDSDGETDLEFEDIPIDDNTGEVVSTVGMTEEDMIKFAMEESKRAQLSATRPEAGFRPSSRRKDIRASNSRDLQTRAPDRPLFVRDESMQEKVFQNCSEETTDNAVTTVEGPPSTKSDDEAKVWEDEEARELREAIAMSLSKVPTRTYTEGSAAGGFIPDDDDEEDIVMPGTSHMGNAPKVTEIAFVSTSSALPFEKLDFSASMFSKTSGLVKGEAAKISAAPSSVDQINSRPLDKLQKAMRSVLDSERVDLADIEDSEIRADQQTTTKSRKDETNSTHKLSIPTWFEEEIERPRERPRSASPEVQETSMDTTLIPAPAAIDLTQNELTGSEAEPSDHESVGLLEPRSTTPISVPSETTSVTGSPIQTPADVTGPTVKDAREIIDEHDPLETQRPGVASEAEVGSPAWSEVSETLHSEHVQGVASKSSELDQSASLPISPEHDDPAIVDEDVALDEVDQIRLLEEEDQMHRMAAEEDEYARFSAELGNKRAENYSNEEYEQDLRALKNQQKKNLRDADEVTQIMVLECQELLAQFGIPYITAASEAESQCAKLVQLNLVDGIVTDDSDVFLFGGTRVYRNMFNTAKTVECYVLSDLEREFELDREKLIKLAHLLGSDYTEGIKKIGPVLALELVAAFPGAKGLEDFRDYVDRVQSATETEDDKTLPFRQKFRKTAEKLVLPDNFPNPMVKEAYVHPEVDADTSAFEWGQPDVDALRSFLMRACGWRQEYTDSQLLPVIKDMNVRSSSNVT